MTLRDIVRKHLEDEVGRKYYGDSYYSTPEEEIRKTIGLAEKSIDIEVEEIINAFIRDMRRGSPEANRERILKIFIAFIVLAASAGLGHAVNIENLVYMGIMVTIIFVTQVYEIVQRW